MVALGDFEDDPGTAFLIFFTPLPRPSRSRKGAISMKEIKSSQKTHQDTHPVTHQDNPQANQVTTPDGKPVVSLNDLKLALPGKPRQQRSYDPQEILEQPWRTVAVGVLERL